MIMTLCQIKYRYLPSNTSTGGGLTEMSYKITNNLLIYTIIFTLIVVVNINVYYHDIWLNNPILNKFIFLISTWSYMYYLVQ